MQFSKWHWSNWLKHVSGSVWKLVVQVYNKTAGQQLVSGTLAKCLYHSWLPAVLPLESSVASVTAGQGVVSVTQSQKRQQHNENRPTCKKRHQTRSQISLLSWALLGYGLGLINIYSPLTLVCLLLQIGTKEGQKKLQEVFQLSVTPYWY